MKQISKFLISYITEECGQKIPEGPAAGDLKLIAMGSENAETLKASLVDKKYIEIGSSADYTMQLLKLVLLAAINSPRAAEYIERMPTFSTSTQAYLKSTIEEVMNGDTWQRRAYVNPGQIQDFGNHETGHQSRPSSSMPDPELLLEERLARQMAENDDLLREKKEVRKELHELHERLIRLQENNVSRQVCLANIQID